MLDSPAMKRLALQFVVIFAAALAALFVYDLYRSRRASGDFGAGAIAERKRVVSSDLARAAGAARTSVAEFYVSNARWPAANRDAGLPEPDAYRGESLRRLEIERNRITLTFDARSGVDGGRVVLTGEPTPALAMGISWRCTSPDIPDIAAILPGCAHEPAPALAATPSAASAAPTPAGAPTLPPAMDPVPPGLYELFDDPEFATGTAGWTTVTKDAALSVGVDPDARTRTPDVLVVEASTEAPPVRVDVASPCVHAFAGGLASYGVRVHVVDGSVGSKARFNCGAFADARCTESVKPSLGSSRDFPAHTWTQLGPATDVLPGSTNYVRCVVSFEDGESRTLRAAIDGVYFHTSKPE